MSEIILETKNLSKKYKNVYALKDVSIRLEKNHIYGFIGENGAGKSTLMKIITGLIFPTAGEFSLMGANTPKEIEKKRKDMGTLIELPTLYVNYSIRKNVEFQRVIVGNPDESATDQVLEMVGLLQDADKKAKNLSMGTKQRLALALALVGNPKFLILDEPINGLDPKNIIKLRNLLKKLNEEHQVTIFVSSHILSELFLLATDFIFIHKGTVLEKVTHEELEERCRQYILVKADDIPKTVTVLEKAFPDVEYKVVSGDSIRIFAKSDIKSDIARYLMEADIFVSELSVKEQSLEEYFMNIIGGENND